MKVDSAAIERQRRWEGTFVPISNVGPERKSDEMLLMGYKSQIQMENLFRVVATLHDAWRVFKDTKAYAGHDGLIHGAYDLRRV